MILDCIYSTNTDVGIFESAAKLNLETGEVFDIETSSDDGQDDIETVNSEEIYFTFEGKEYTFEVEFNDSEYILKNNQDLKVIQAIQSASDLEKVLPEKTVKKQNKI